MMGRSNGDWAGEKVRMVERRGENGEDRRGDEVVMGLKGRVSEVR